MSFKLTDKDHGFKALMEYLKGSKKLVLKVGIFGQKADQDHDGISNVELGEIHEFGLGVPERSFIRSWVDENKKEALARLKADSTKAVRGELKPRQVLERLGLFAVGGIQQRIADGGPYKGGPLAESTIKRKGSSMPLVDKGQLRSSVTYAVEEDE